MAEVWPALGQAMHRGQGELGGIGLRSKGVRPHARKCVSGALPSAVRSEGKGELAVLGPLWTARTLLVLKVLTDSY